MGNFEWREERNQNRGGQKEIENREGNGDFRKNREGVLQKKNRGNINEKERKKKEQMTKDEKKIEREGIREKNRFLVWMFST